MRIRWTGFSFRFDMKKKIEGKPKNFKLHTVRSFDTQRGGRSSINTLKKKKKHIF